MPFFDVLIEDVSALPSQRPAAGQYLATTMGAGGAGNGTAGGIGNRITIHPYLARSGVTIDQAAIIVTTGIAAALAKVVIYAADANGYPAALIYESATLDCSAAATVTVAFPVTLVQGVTYWIGLMTSSTATMSQWTIGSCPDIQGGIPVTTARKALRRVATFGSAAPNPWGTFDPAEILNLAPYAVWLRVA